MKKEKIYNIKNIVKKGVCVGCGTCVALCPQGAIELIIDKKKGIYVPKIDKSKCNNCGICLKVCPGVSIDYGQLGQEIFGKKPEDVLIGNYLNCYTGHATDYNIRYNSASGGLVTSLLIYALEKGIIDGALVTRMKKDKPLEPEPFIARTKEEIIQASKSKYCPVPVNIGLKEILNSKEGEKFAVVGLPCDIYGIRRAETINKKLREKIVLHLGIFCSHLDSFEGTEFLFHKLGIKKEEVVKINYRGGGWPGEVKIQLKNGNEKIVKLAAPLWITFHDSCLFFPIRCLLCNDLTNELADISFGDAWLPEIMQSEKTGKSIIITRTTEGERLLNQAISVGCINLLSIDINKVIQSQKTFLHFKKINIRERVKILKLSNKKYSLSSKNKISFYNKFVALFSIINSYVGSRLSIILKCIPIKILKLYTSAFYKLYGMAIKKDFNNLNFKKVYNILILHAHWGNRGDEAAIRAMIDSLKEKFPIKKIKIMIMVKSIDWFPYNDIEIIPFYPFPKIYYLDALLTLATFGKFSFTKKGKSFLKAIDGADFIIHAPGGPAIGDLYSGKLYDFPYLYRLLLGKVFKKKPLFFYAPSMGPFSGKIRNFIRKFILKRADAIILREEISAKYLKEQLGLDSYITADSALQNEIPENYIQKYMDNPEVSRIWETLKKKKVVGMTITDLGWHLKYKNNFALQERIINSLIEASKYIINKNYKIILIPQLFDESHERWEISLLKKIREIDKRKIFLLPIEVDSYAQQIIISKLFCVIGMRYHPSIFAAKNKTPFIPICYEHKIEGFVKKLGLEELMIDIENIDAIKIIDKFNYLEKNYAPIKRFLNKRVPDLVIKSRRTTEIILEKLERPK